MNDSVIIQNKYSKLYFKIMERAKTRSISDYTERHHILPKSLGGDNSADNIVRLTAREHYIAHLLLTKCTSGNNLRKMAFALSYFNTGCKNLNRERPSGRWYEYSRRLLSESRKGIQFTNAHKAALSKAKKGVIISSDQRKKLSDSLKRSIPFFALSPDNKSYSGECLKSFCAVNNISYHRPRQFIKSICVITAGRNKGWMFSSYEISDAEAYRNNVLKNHLEIKLHSTRAGHANRKAVQRSPN